MKNLDLCVLVLIVAVKQKVCRHLLLPCTSSLQPPPQCAGLCCCCAVCPAFRQTRIPQMKCQVALDIYAQRPTAFLNCLEARVDVCYSAAYDLLQISTSYCSLKLCLTYLDDLDMSQQFFAIAGGFNVAGSFVLFSTSESQFNLRTEIFQSNEVFEFSAWEECSGPCGTRGQTVGELIVPFWPQIMKFME